MFHEFGGTLSFACINKKADFYGRTDRVIPHYKIYSCHNNGKDYIIHVKSRNIIEIPEVDSCSGKNFTDWSEQQQVFV